MHNILLSPRNSKDAFVRECETSLRIYLGIAGTACKTHTTGNILVNNLLIGASSSSCCYLGIAHDLCAFFVVVNFKI